MADVVVTLREVLPNLMADKNKAQFLGYVNFINEQIAEARFVGISASTKISLPLCVNNDTATSCGGPPETNNTCLVCAKPFKL